MLSHGLDLLIRPNVYSFALRAVLRMKRDDFLDGCRHAARATHAALRSSMEADDAPLSQLEADAAIAPALHAELSREISRGRDAGALDLMLATLGEQSRMLEDDVPVTLGHVRLICGTQRVSTTTMLAGSHRLHIGSHLIVIDDRDDGLWRVDRQRELLLRRARGTTGLTLLQASLVLHVSDAAFRLQVQQRCNQEEQRKAEHEHGEGAPDEHRPSERRLAKRKAAVLPTTSPEDFRCCARCVAKCL